MAKVTIRWKDAAKEATVYRNVSPQVASWEGMLCITGEGKGYMVPKEDVAEVEIRNPSAGGGNPPG